MSKCESFCGGRLVKTTPETMDYDIEGDPYRDASYVVRLDGQQLANPEDALAFQRQWEAENGPDENGPIALG